MNSPDVFSVVLGGLVLTFMAVAVVGFIVYYQRKQFKTELKRRKEIQELREQHQRQLLENSLEVQESVRRGVSKDLHDEIGGLLSATKMSIMSLSKNLPQDQQFVQKFEGSKKLVEEALIQVRNLSRELVPRTLESFGLIAALNEFFNKMELATDINFDFLHDNLENEERFPANIELSVYRIIQELSNNAIKHSAADTIQVSIKKNAPEVLQVIFQDNGKGYDLNEKLNESKSGLGLWNIISRITVVGGEYTFESSPGEGSKVLINIPV